MLHRLKAWGVPGFRSSTPLKEIVAAIGYLVIAVWILSIFIGRPGLSAFGVACLLVVLLVTNGWGLRSRLPLLNSVSRASTIAGWAIVGIVVISTWAWAGAETQAASSPGGQTSLHTGAGGVGGGAPQATSGLFTASTPAAALTATPKPTPSPKPTPAPTPKPTSAATVAAPPATTVAFVNAPLTARPGQTATLIARTSPNTACTIEVDYKSGPSTAQGLVPKTSDGAGNVSWSWFVGTRTTPGQWPISVTCGSAANQTYINVV